MAESTLSMHYNDLLDAMSFFVHGQADADSLSAADKANLVTCLKSGYRQFLYPPGMEGVEAGYEWSFLRPLTTLTTTEAYETGTLEVASGTCTLTGGTWPSWAATHGILTIGAVEYTVSSRDGDTLLTVVGDDVDSGEDDWSLAHDGDYDLPDNFGRLLSDFTFARGTQKPAILADVGEGKILKNRNWSDETGDPRMAGIKTVAPANTESARKQVMFWPRPTEETVLTYQYEILVDALISTPTYPACAMKHMETVRESCLSMAEITFNDRRGSHWDLFRERLIGSIARDKKESPKYFGDVGPGSQYSGRGSGFIDTSYGLTAYGTRIQ